MSGPNDVKEDSPAKSAPLVITGDAVLPDFAKLVAMSDAEFERALEAGELDDD